MRRKFRTCDVSGCHQPVFGNNKCRSHQYLISKSPIIPKDITFQKGLNQNITIISPFNSEVEMFRWIWKNRSHQSFLSGRDLNYIEGESLWYNQFVHVLPKGINAFPLFKLNPNNIILLTPYEHTLLDHGTQQQRKDYPYDWNKINMKAMELWTQYKELVPGCSPLPRKLITTI